MLKRLTLLCLVLLISQYAFSAESGPSNTVGFITFNCPQGTWTPFAFPFTYYTQGHIATTSFSSIMGGNFVWGTPDIADWVWDLNAGTFAYMDPQGNWVGTLTDVTPGHAYSVLVQSINPPVLAVTAGEVDMTALNLGTMALGFNPVGLREPGEIDLTDMNLLPSGFTGGNPATSDRVWDQNTLSYSFYNSTTNAWMGALSEGVEPGHALWIEVRNTPFSWTYTPLGGGQVQNAITPAPAKPNRSTANN
jgi:hypothetical protein